jgi:hypothetical protein
MVEKIGHIKNPLTVIAIFAALAEVSGTVVLPFLNSTTQELYVWFLMGFPLFLVAIFFFVLYTKNHVLYAPSDYKDEQTFKDIFVGAASAKVDKIFSEVEQPVPEAIEEATPSAPSSTKNIAVSPPAPSSEAFTRSFRGDGLLAEELVLAKFAKELGMRFQRNVALKGQPKLVFDGVSTSDKKAVVVEVRFTRAGLFPNDVIKEYFDRANNFANALPDNLKGNVEFIYVVVSDREDRMDRIEKTLERIREQSLQYPFRTSVQFFKLQDLEHEFQADR